LEGGLDLFGEGGIGWGDFGEEVEGVGGFFESGEVGLGVGEREEMVAVAVFGELADAGCEDVGFLRVAIVFEGVCGEVSCFALGSLVVFGGVLKDGF